MTEYIEPSDITAMPDIKEPEGEALKSRTAATLILMQFLEQEYQERPGDALIYDYDSVKENVVKDKSPSQVRNLSYERTLQRDIDDLFARELIPDRWFFLKTYSPRLRAGRIEFVKIPKLKPKERGKIVSTDIKARVPKGYTPPY